MLFTKENTFENEFDLTYRELNEIHIKETYSRDSCFIWDVKDSSKSYTSFILSKNSLSKIVCVLNFHKSSQTNKYLPRPSFKRLSLDGTEKSSSSGKVNISLNTSDDALNFWKLIAFLHSFKDLVDFGDFNTSFKVVSADTFILEFKNKEITEKIKNLKDLINLSDLNSNDIKSLLYETRKKDVKVFYFLLKNIKNCHEKYKERYSLPQGEESIWHHFLKKQEWILGLNVDIKFIRDFYDEQKIGNENSLGSQSPKTDMLGISDFTTLIELKCSTTEIFKKTKSKGRANTWDFTSDFIEGISQCLGQKTELEKMFDQKNFLKDGKRLDKTGIETIDPKTLLIIGNRKVEFPLHDLIDVNFIKSNTFERFRRSNRNVEVVTFDELFERAYHIVFSEKLPSDWYEKEDLSIFE
jgi:hypothetical protein